MRKSLLPPAYFFGAIVLMVVLHYSFPLIKLIPSPYNYLGALLIIIGLLMNIRASNLFNKVNTTVKPFETSTYLVTEGLFGLSRHPMYLGMVIALSGLFILLGSIAPFVIIPIFIWLMEKKFISMEEKALEETFGEAYRQYKRKVRRWI